MLPSFFSYRVIELGSASVYVLLVHQGPFSLCALLFKYFGCEGEIWGAASLVYEVIRPEKEVIMQFLHLF